MKHLAASAALLILAGCANKAWMKTGTTEEDFITDRGDCVSRAFVAPTVYQQNMIFTGCMQSKGWRWVEVEQQRTQAATKSALHFCGDEAEKLSRTRDSFDPSYKSYFERCMNNNDPARMGR